MDSGMLIPMWRRSHLVLTLLIAGWASCVEPRTVVNRHCSGRESQWTGCNMRPCRGNCKPVHCDFNQWSDWHKFGGCTGLGKRHRDIRVHSNECGRPCEGDKEETKRDDHFMLNSCRIEDRDCEWGPWTDWSECGRCLDCRRNQKVKTRVVQSQASGKGHPCRGESNITEACGAENPVYCEMTDWSEWTQCSKRCGGGWKAKLRRIKDDAKYGGPPCGDKQAVALRETIECNTQECSDAIDCKIHEWEDWVGCTGSTPHHRIRKRGILQYSTHGGKACDDVIKETAGCESPQHVPCAFTTWTDWTECPVTCGSGQQERTRSIPTNRHCQAVLLESTHELRGCATTPCSHMCNAGPWSEWSDCSATCGGGVTTRSRKVDGQGRCNQPLSELQRCAETTACPLQDCEWGPWQGWAKCTLTCGGGIMRRERMIAKMPRNGGEPCSAADRIDVGRCNEKPCHECIDGVWSTWSEWNQCSGTCFPAFRDRSRKVQSPGNDCGRPPVGPGEEYELCHELNPCEEQVDCLLSTWAPWSECSNTCWGIRGRTRNLTQPSSHFGSKCKNENLQESEGCNPGKWDNVPSDCLSLGPQPCKFSPWEDWGTCSKTCDRGEAKRERQVTSLATNGGQPCTGALSQLQPCQERRCNPNEHCEDCLWSTWSEWSDCPKCGGQHFRTRSVEQKPNHCGLKCNSGMGKETQLCNTVCQERSFCAWSAWTEVGECSATCGSASKPRTRSLQKQQGMPPSPDIAFMASNQSLNCSGKQTDLALCPWKGCEETACKPLDCKLEDWMEWSEPACTQLCERHRNIAQPSECMGKPCDGAMMETKTCPKFCNQPLDCVVGSWDAWGTCDAASSYQKYRRRKIIQDPVNGGKLCTPQVPLKETGECMPDPTVVNCKLESIWEDWDACSKICGGGVHTRVRKMVVSAKNGGSPCQGALEQLASCNNQKCDAAMDKDCVLTDWEVWASCDSSNQQERQRSVAAFPVLDGKPCTGALHEIQPCKVAKDCEVTPWAKWDECDKSCGGAGTQQRQRQVVGNPENNGKPCPHDLIELRGCKKLPCPSNVNCEESEWESWGACSATCGSGIRERNRRITQKREYDGEGCKSILSETQNCPGKLPPCPKSCKVCKWGEWGEWSECSVHCGGGQREHARDIVQYPEPGCDLCEAKSKVAVEACNTQDCSKTDICIDGEWNDWGMWSMCSASCRGGVSRRERSLRRKNTACGQPAIGKDQEVKDCNVGSSCEPNQDCVFGQWNNWSPCSATCAGIKSRSRKILVHGVGDGAYCEGSTKETWTCAFDQHAAIIDWRKPDLSIHTHKLITTEADPSSNLRMRKLITSEVDPSGKLRMRFEAAAEAGGRVLDLLVISKAGAVATDSKLNGRQGQFGSVNLRGGAAANVTFSFVETKTDKPVAVEDAVLKFFDLDASSDRKVFKITVNDACEEFYVSGDDSYFTRKGNCDPGQRQPVTFTKQVHANPSCEDGTAYDFVFTNIAANNLAGKGPLIKDAHQIRYNKVAQIDGHSVDLVIEVQDQSGYEPGDQNHNGYQAPDFASINLLPGEMSHFKVTFVNSDNNQPQRMYKFNITFFDVDHPDSTVHEVIEANDIANWYYPKSLARDEGKLSVETRKVNSKEIHTFTSTQKDVRNPDAPEPGLLTDEQAANSLQFAYHDVSEFNLGLRVQRRGPLGGVRDDRTFIFAGKYCLFPAGAKRRLQDNSGSCHSATPTVKGMGPGGLNEEEERRAIAVRFRNVSEMSFGLEVEKGCGHTFLFAGKACISGSCDPCSKGMGCEFSAWQEWEPCPVTCGGAEQVRSRRTFKTAKGRNGGDCRGAVKMAKSCGLAHCSKNCTPVNCEWGEWHVWGACSPEGGQRYRNRAVKHHSECGGQACMPGDSEEIKKCERVKRDNGSLCAWQDWTAWTACTVSCGCGRKHRQRSVHVIPDSTPSFVAKFATGASSQGRPNARLPGSLGQLRDFQAIGVAFFAGCFSILGVLVFTASCRHQGNCRPLSRQHSTEADFIAENHS